MIAAAILVAYCLASLFAARRIYSRTRANEIKRFPHSAFDGEDQVLYGAMAMITGILWPLILPVAIVVYKPAKTPEELKAERDAMARRIRELEAELGMRGTP